MTGIIVLCRFNSSRLPGKILKPIKGKPILEYIIERLRNISGQFTIVVCTSNEKTDNPIVDFCSEREINIFRGSLQNVAKRFLDCAEHYGFTTAVRINGDNLFLDGQLLRKIINDHEKGGFKFSSNVKDRTFPKGMSVEVVDTDYYKENYRFFKKSDFEHVMTYFYRQESKKHKFHYYEKILSDDVNFAIDTEKDFSRACKIIDSMKRKHTHYGIDEIIQINKDIE